MVTQATSHRHFIFIRKQVSAITLTVIAGFLTPALALAQTDARAMAEWERTEAVIFSWARFNAAIIDRYPAFDPEAEARRSELLAYAKCELFTTTFQAILEADAEIIITDHVDGENDFEQFAEECNIDISEGFNIVEIEPSSASIGAARCDDFWARDGYPVTTYEEEDNLPGAAGIWRCEEVADALGIDSKVLVEDEAISTTEIKTYEDGGNYLTNGHGLLVLEQSQWANRFEDTRYEEVIDTYYQNTAGITEIVKLPIAQGHVDYSVKLLDEETVLLATPREENFFFDEYVALQNSAKEYFSSTEAWTGRAYKIYEIPEVVATYNPDYAITGKSHYANSLIVNDTILVGAANIPGVVDHEEADLLAKSIYEEAMPGYKVVMLPYAAILHSQGGSIHCITANLGELNPIQIEHQWLKGQVEHSSSGYEIEATLVSNLGIQAAEIYWRKHGDQTFQMINMTSESSTSQDPSRTSKKKKRKNRRGQESGENGEQTVFGSETWRGTIPSGSDGDVIEYYILATDGTGKQESLPLVAPGANYSFEIASSMEVN